MPKKIHASASATPTTCGKGRKSRMNQDFMPRVLRKAQKESQNAKVKMQNRQSELREMRVATFLSDSRF
jgi:hypothetical protein